ncbi:TolB family protein [Caldisericum exile]|uniref:TolB family protein n=1 Tax=Caldisericum exile TaxID=693075 RepID=UPI003C75142A
MKNKIIIFFVILVLIASAVVAVWSLSTKITSTPILVKANGSFLKIDEKGRVTKLSDVSKNDLIKGIGFYADNFIYTSQSSDNSPITSIWNLNTKTHELTELTKGIGNTFFSPMIKGDKLIFESKEPFGIWVVDLENSSKVNVAEGLEPSTGGSGTQFGEFIISKDSKWIIFTAFDPVLKKNCYFSTRVDGSKRVNLTGNVPIPLLAIDVADRRPFIELTAFSEDGKKLFFSFANNGKELSYFTSIDGNFRATLPYGYFVSFINNDSEIILLYPNPTTGKRSILKVSIDGKIQNNLTKDLQGDCYEVKLSPQNDKIIFTFAPIGSQEYSLWIMNIDGSNKQKLTDKTEGILYPMPFGFVLIPNSNKIIYQIEDPDLRKWSLWTYDMDNSAKTKLLGDSETDYTFAYLASNGKCIIVRSGENVLLASTNGDKKEILEGNFGSNTFSILNDYLIYQDSKNNSLYLLDLSTDTKLKIKENFLDNILGDRCQISTNGKDILIAASTKEGLLQYYLFNTQNHKFTDLNKIIKGEIFFVNLFY